MAATATSLFETLDGAGAVDFDVLTEAELVAWLGRVGAWPAGMPPTLSLEALDLDESDLDEE